MPRSGTAKPTSVRMLGDWSAAPAAEDSPPTSLAKGAPKRSGTHAGCSIARAGWSCSTLRARGSAAATAARARVSLNAMLGLS